ncbi:MAG: hypothetical protein KIT62_12680, partial [Cyclobacteriaceae bacterium]|nr:hypothetical protein [Cyclobacteriaceae bacterium]
MISKPLKSAEKNSFWRVVCVPVLACLLVLNSVTGSMAQDHAKKFPESFQVEVINPLNDQREEVLIIIPASAIQARAASFNSKAFV